MIADAVDLDEHRGMMAQRARTSVSRGRGTRLYDQQQEQPEDFLLAAPSASWPEAAEKVACLFTLLATSSEARVPRREHGSAPCWAVSSGCGELPDHSGRSNQQPAHAAIAPPRIQTRGFEKKGSSGEG